MTLKTKILNALILLCGLAAAVLADFKSNNHYVWVPFVLAALTDIKGFLQSLGGNTPAAKLTEGNDAPQD